MAKEEYRNYILLIASLLFYSYGEPRFVFVMLGSIAFNYMAALLVDKYRGKKAADFFLVTDIIINAGILFIYKYLGFAISITNQLFKKEIRPTSILLPIGISFFTFQALSYVIDVYRGDVVVQKNPLFVALYIAFFPQLIAGPIVRYSTIENQICKRNCSIELFSEGARRFLLGFGKKVILANNLALVAKNAFSRDLTITNPLFLWLGSICFSLQIYYDFSGYSDMAIGLGRMFGFEFEENFNYPYTAKSVTDFWHRWHISLSRWFRDYVYIPLGGSKGVSGPRLILNMFVVWMLTGIWHGANYTFIVWGIGYFCLLVVEKMFVRPSLRTNRLFKIIWQITTLLCINFGWVIFNSQNFRIGIGYCLAMIGHYRNHPTIDNDILYNWGEYRFFIVAGILFSTPVMRIVLNKLEKTRINPILTILEPVTYGAILIWSVSFLILGAHNPFIYFNF